MPNIFRKLLAMLLCGVMLWQMSPSAFAADGEPEQEFPLISSENPSPEITNQDASPSAPAAPETADVPVEPSPAGELTPLDKPELDTLAELESTTFGAPVIHISGVADGRKNDSVHQYCDPPVIEIKAEAGLASVTVSYNDSDFPQPVQAGAAKYCIYYKTGTGSWLKLTETSAASYLWKNGKPGTAYSFTVQAVKGSTLSSYDSAGASITREK